MRKLALLSLLSLCISLGAVVGCHASEDDAAGLSEELADPVRRRHAVTSLQKLYSKLLRENSGDRSSAPIQAFHDEVVDNLNSAFIDNRMDTQNTLTMLGLMKEMQEPRMLPALIAALDWRMEVSENHAIYAAQALKSIDVPDDKKTEVAQALGAGIEKVTGARSEDNRLRIEMLQALGSLETHAATPILTKVATTQTEEQNFLINRLAAQQLGDLGDPAAIEPMIKGLFLFAPSNPAMRMNDVAAEALVRIGRPALDPLLALLRGQNDEAKEIARLYIEAIRARDENAAAQMNVDQVVGGEATFALGALGFREAMPPLMQETEAEQWHRKLNGAIAIVRLNLESGDLPGVRSMLQRVYSELPDDMQGQAARAQLIAAIRSLYDEGMMPFLLNQAKDSDVHPQVREQAVLAYALLANRAQANQLKRYLDGLSDDDGYKARFSTLTEHAIATATECDADINCYIGKLGDSEKEVVRKAAFALGRFGRGNEQAVTALVGKLDHAEIEVRLSALGALDRAASSGSQAAVDKISELQRVEEGRGIWRQFEREALPVQARLRARAGS